MADAKIVQIADAVVAELNGASFSQAFTAIRKYVPTYDLPDLAALAVTVVPKARAETLASRADDRVDYTVDLAVQKKISTDAEIDGLMGLVEQIAAFLNRRKLSDVADATWVGTENNPIFLPEHLEQLRQFTSILAVTYRTL